MRPSKERKYRTHAVLHQRKAFLHVHLSKELKKKLNTKKRTILIKKRDTVKIRKGKYKGKTAKVMRVNYSNLKIYLEGITRRDNKGTEKLIAFSPYNVEIIDGDFSKERKAKVVS